MTTSPDFARMKRDLAGLVAIDSQNPPGRERETAERIRDLITPAGFDVDLSDIAAGRTNVVARLANGPGPVFAFNTHMDVVPVGEGWTSDPLTLREDTATGRLYGRGACDAKGPLAAMLEAMRLLAADRTRWSGTLLGIFVADEEVASAGAKALVAEGGPRVDFAVVGEPTSNATFRAHKGSLRPVVRVHGVAAHSGTPHLGDNAIYRAGELISLIARHHDDVVCRRRHPLVGAASLTVTRILGGHADNVVPEACDLLLDRRMVPGEDESEVAAELAALFEGARRNQGVRAEIVEFKATTGGATETPAYAPIVGAALAACRDAGVADPGPFGFQGGCDLVHFRALGASGVVIGPGDLAVAHKPDEFVPVDEFFAAAGLYRDIAETMLG
ncbi:M20 family peptidase [Siculibacillus lacustris]|uniref:M20 family peptidase n=1 Tax=Siculibacillus lacustris TaxID=1549641 RepID=A0A4Q9VL88_9HYPH|nr:M20 family metallopeptidase [Siculibacillus lacustris]TBW35369.1 M20 family peptidase [Siculibacillus lacustris]